MPTSSVDDARELADLVRGLMSVSDGREWSMEYEWSKCRSRWTDALVADHAAALAEIVDRSRFR